MYVTGELTLTFLPLQVLQPVLDFLCDTLFPVLLFRCFLGSEVPDGVDVVEYPESSGTMRLSSSAMVIFWMAMKNKEHIQRKGRE